MRTIVFLCLLSLFSSTQALEVGDGLGEAIENERFKQITSVLVAKDGALVYEKYWGEGDRNLLNDTRSATKSLTAMALGAAIADGHIASVQEPIYKHFEAERPYRFTSARKDSITVQDLLTMSSALDCNDNVWTSPGNEEHMYPARSWTYFFLDLPTKDDYVRDTNGFGPFSYCTAGSFFLGQIIERASGQKISEYVASRIFKPLGIERVEWPESPSGEIQTGGGTRLTSRDLMKLGELVRVGGTHNGVEVLPEAWTDAMMTPHLAANGEQNYGYQWWQREFTCGQQKMSGWYMAGNGGNKIVVLRDLDMTVVVTATLYGTNGMHQQSTDIINDFVLPHVPACASD